MWKVIWLQNVFWGLACIVSVLAMSGCKTINEENDVQSPTFPGISISHSTTTRFIANGDGTVTDQETGLIWLQEAACFPVQSQPEAIVAAATLANGMCGLTDGSKAGAWRLPTMKELLSLIDYTQYGPALPQGHPFLDVFSWYWSATPSAKVEGMGWVVDLDDGDDSHIDLMFQGGILPVRGSGNLPVPALIDNGNGTITDLSTDLIWLKEASCLGTLSQTEAMSLIGIIQDGVCGLTDGSKAGDWRLPTIKELLSLVDYSHYDPALPAGHPFVDLGLYYWSSTNLPVDSFYAWNVYLGAIDDNVGGDLAGDPVTILGFILPVRSR